MCLLFQALIASEHFSILNLRDVTWACGIRLWPSCFELASNLHEVQIESDRLEVFMQHVKHLVLEGSLQVHACWCEFACSRRTSCYWWLNILLREFGRIAGPQASHRLRLQTVQARRPSLVQNCFHSLDFSPAESFKQSGERSAKHFRSHTSQPVLFTFAGTRWSRRLDARCWSSFRQPHPLVWLVWRFLRTSQWPGDTFEDFLHKTFASMTIELVRQKRQILKEWKNPSVTWIKTGWKVMCGNSCRGTPTGAVGCAMMVLCALGLEQTCWWHWSREDFQDAVGLVTGAPSMIASCNTSWRHWPQYQGIGSQKMGQRQSCAYSWPKDSAWKSYAIKPRMAKSRLGMLRCFVSAPGLQIPPGLKFVMWSGSGCRRKWGSSRAACLPWLNWLGLSEKVLVAAWPCYSQFWIMSH